MRGLDHNASFVPQASTNYGEPLRKKKENGTELALRCRTTAVKHRECHIVRLHCLSPVSLSFYEKGTNHTLNPPSLRRRSHHTMASRRHAFASVDRAYSEDVDSANPMEKDEDEAKLERLVFGDVAGFQGALKGHEVDSGALVKVPGSDAESVVPDEEQEDGGLAEVDDTDVSPLIISAFVWGDIF